MSAPVPTVTNADDPLLGLLSDGELEVEGRLVDASNLALRVWLTDGDRRIPAVYKPVQGERPLWDFPDGSLAGREWAAWLVSTASGWNFLPRTVLREGPLGLGTVQEWVGPLEGREDADVVRIDRPQDVPAGNIPVLQAQDDHGRPLVVSHSDTPRLRSLALFDALLNNADRKASALLADGDDFWAIDHGLCFHHEDKLRTVFWGFAQDPISDDDLAVLQRIRVALDQEQMSHRLAEVLTAEELAALDDRLTQLQRDARLPAVPDDRHPLPWPLW